jgi:Tfp pilus assembly protein PilO
VNRRAPIIAAGAFLLVGVLLVVLLVLPKMGEVGETQDELTTAQDQEIALEAQLRALQDAQAEAPETERQIAAIEDQIPPTAELPELFNLLQAAADRSAVDFFSISPGTPVADTAGTFSRIPSSITVTGSYFAIDEFLFLMETLPRAAKVLNITMSPAASAEGVATATTSLQLLMAIEFFTTDTSAGPASVPGPSEPVAAPTTTGPTGPTGDGGAGETGAEG